MRLLPDTIAAHQRRTREHRAKPIVEKGDARRYPIHTLAPDPEQAELDLHPQRRHHEAMRDGEV